MIFGMPLRTTTCGSEQWRRLGVSCIMAGLDEDMVVG